MVHWPVLFIYPESSYEDCIEDVREDETFEVRLELCALISSIACPVHVMESS